jgi:hypothetical protein
MPTKRRRLTVTETPEIAQRLDVAAAHFPARADSRKELLLVLTEVGAEALAERGDEDDPREAAKRRVLAETRSMTEEEGLAMLAAREAGWQHDLGG